MKPERWQQVREIVGEAMDLSPADRKLHVEKVCSGDDDLRAEVESLLGAHDEAGSVFLRNPAANLAGAAAAALLTPERVGRRIGVYRLIGEIGHGGMGEVYRAVRADGVYDKEVAIKLMRGGLDAEFLLERFRHERQILASLDHPNIARLFDGGTTEDGVPYLVMELIEGTPIDRYCEQHELDIPKRLQLFVQVCAAVHYAHQRLVIHRDIKPSNILVTAEGVPKLLDFGIAKIVDSSGGQETTLLRPMTPEYASPEQIRGEPITTATDEYSLGMVLYKLLTGRSPYPERTRAPLEFAELICHAEPARPSAFALKKQASGRTRFIRALKGDLDNIVLKALRKEPERRYASAEQLAEDIRRHLQGLPVTAMPDSIVYRLNKFVRRHRMGMAAAMVIVLTLSGGVAATLREARVAVRERARAERRFHDVRKLASSFLFEFDAAIKDLPGSTPARSLVVKRALEYLDGLAAEARGDRSLQLEIASAYQKVAEVQGNPMFPNLGDSKGALESSRKALGILDALSRSEPQNQQVRLSLASTHQLISDVLDYSGDTAAAVEHSRQALRIYEGLAGELGSDPKFQIARLVQTYHYANLLKSVGGLGQAAEEYRKAVELSRQMIGDNPSEPEGKVHLATSLDGLGNVLQELGDTAGALDNRRLGLGIREDLANLDPNNAHYRRQLAFSHHNVALSLVEAGEFASALAHFRKELSLFEALSAADPKDVQGRRNRSLAHKQIGDLLLRTSDVHAALEHYRHALDIDRELTSLDPGNSQAVLDLSFSQTKVGSALGKMGQRQEALAMLRTGVATQESLLAKDPNHILLYNHLANSYRQLADFLLAIADRKSAIAYFRKAVAARLTLSEKSPNSRMNRAALAECYASLAKALEPIDRSDTLKQYNNAIELLESLAAGDRMNAQDRITQAEISSNVARLYVRMASQERSTTRLLYWTKAKDHYQRSNDLWEELSRVGKLSPARLAEIRQVNDELARCNQALRQKASEEGVRSAEGSSPK